MTLSEPPLAARNYFGAQLPTAQRYAELLAGAGIERGLLGPREVPRLWDRHLLNCAAIAELVPARERVVDVGSGAGLPGLAVAIARPDLRVDLVESLQRRTQFLSEAVNELDLADRVRVVRGRAEDPVVVSTVGRANCVTARAVAPLDRLVRWCLPLLVPAGKLLAVKGSSAHDEMMSSRAAVRQLGGAAMQVVTCGKDLDEPVSIVVVSRETAHARRKGGR